MPLRLSRLALPILLPILLASPLRAQDEAASEARGNAALGGKETVLRVLQLSQELEKLLATLPAETQEELRGMLMDRLAAPAAAETSSAEAGEAETNRDPVEKPPESATQLARQPVADLETRVEPAPTLAEPSAREPIETETSQSEPPITEARSVEPTSVAASGAEATEPTAVIAEIEPPGRSDIVRDRADATVSTAIDPVTPTPQDPATALRNRRGCRTLVPFDSDGDGKLTGLDRFWRHFYLWTDVNENRSVDEKELESPYERGIREIDVNLRSFVRGKGKRKRSLEIQLEEHILLDVGGDGWSGADPRGDDGALALDLSAIREAGGPDFKDGRGKSLEGIQPFRPGWILRLEDGSEIAANCPKG